MDTAIFIAALAIICIMPLFFRKKVTAKVKEVFRDVVQPIATRAGFKKQTKTEVEQLFSEIETVIGHHNRYQQQQYSHFKHFGPAPSPEVITTALKMIKERFNHDVTLQHLHDDIFMIHKK